MTTATPEKVTDSEVGHVLLNDLDFEIVCDISALRLMDPHYPACKGDAARWVAWRVGGCCGKGPRCRLICDYCKKVYQAWMAKQAFLACPYCNQDVGGFAAFTPLGKKA